MSLINCGWLNIYKPLNITSSNTVSKIKKKFKLKKVGHAGTLDPKAEGILPVAFGNATKIISFVTNKSKKYYFIIKWGEQTSTDDSEGSLIYKSRKIPNINEINNNLSKYSGDIYQVPPKYSAIKVNGIRAYQLSRNKNEFKLLPRKVKIYSIEYIENISFNHSEKNTMPKYKIKNERVLYEFMDSFWKNVGRRKGNKFINNLFKV